MEPVHDLDTAVGDIRFSVEMGEEIVMLRPLCVGRWIVVADRILPGKRRLKTLCRLTRFAPEVRSVARAIVRG